MVGVNLNILHARKGVIRRRRKSHASMLCLRSFSAVLGFQSAVTHYSAKPKATLLGDLLCILLLSACLFYACSPNMEHHNARQKHIFRKLGLQGYGDHHP